MMKKAIVLLLQTACTMYQYDVDFLKKKDITKIMENER